MSDRVIVINGVEESLDEYMEKHPEDFYPVDPNGNIQGAIPISSGTASLVVNSSRVEIIPQRNDDVVIKKAG